MKDTQIKEILFDLYMVDEDLKSYEQELKDIILELYYSKPDTEFDEIFKQNLKEELLLKISSLKRDNLNRKINLSDSLPKESNILIFMKKLNYILGGVAASGTAFVVALYFLNSAGYITFFESNTGNLDKNAPVLSNSANTANGIKSQISANIETTPVIAKVASNSFGAITASSIQDNSGYAGISMKGNGQESDISTTAVAPTSTASSPTVDSKMRMYNPVNYNYTYNDTKEKLAYNDSDLEVLKRITKNNFSFDSSSISTNNFNLSNFKNLRLNNLSIDEDADNGYSLYVNFNDGSFSINKNWTKWPVDNGDNKLKVSDIPSDSDLITIANEFITKYGIDTKNYGKPEVINDWKIYYEQSTDKSNYYIPTSISILYPLNINGKYVYEQYGGKAGMNISIDIKSKRVDGLYGAQSQNYESSKYELVKDADRLTKAMSNGGELYNSWVDANAKKVDLKVNNPQIAYMKVYSYTNNTQTELLVPAIILDIEKNNETELYKKNIILPLTSDLISQVETTIKQKEDNIKNGGSGNGGIVPIIDPAASVLRK